MNIAIVGFGSQGKSALEHWSTSENSITVCDTDAKLNLPSGVKAQLGMEYLKDIKRFDLIVRAPGVHPDQLREVPENKITTNTNEFFRVCPTRNIIGVTGTKGKGTTSTLIAQMLKAMGKRVHLGGNIGTPPLELLKNEIRPEDWIVLELANFQLIDLHYSPHIAVCLMIEPEHLDWHKNLDEYIRAKQQLFIHQKADDQTVYYSQNNLSGKIASVSEGKKVPYFNEHYAHIENGLVKTGDQLVCRTSEIKLVGEHNLQNICAAINTCMAIEGYDIKAIRKVLTTFSGLPFRIEKRAEKNGVTYYNDSFASAPGATIAALRSITQPKVLIVGGYERGLGLSALAEEIVASDEHIRRVIVIGASGERVAKELRNAGYNNFTRTENHSMDEIVHAATGFAKKGDAVVLSPAFASFDMFKNFEDRGIKFNEAVERL